VGQPLRAKLLCCAPILHHGLGETWSASADSLPRSIPEVAWSLKPHCLSCVEFGQGGGELVERENLAVAPFGNDGLPPPQAARWNADRRAWRCWSTSMVDKRWFTLGSVGGLPDTRTTMLLEKCLLRCGFDRPRCSSGISWTGSDATCRSGARPCHGRGSLRKRSAGR